MVTTAQYYAPFVGSCALMIASTIAALRIRPEIYVDEELPYRDAGFLILPDWSDYQWPADLLAAVYGGVTAIAIMFTSKRLAVWRRTFAIWSVTQILQAVQQACTRLPNPNPLYTPTWSYCMYPIAFTMSPLLFTFYCPQPALVLASWLTCVAGNLLIIACHKYYTIDVVCAVVVVTLVFLWYHWHARSSASIQRRPWIKWFELDYLGNSAEYDEPLGPNTVVAVPDPHDGTVVSGNLAHDRDSAMTTSSPPHGPASASVMSMVDNASIFLQHFRHPTFIHRSHYEEAEDAMFQWAASMSDKRKKYHPAAAAALTVVFNILVAGCVFGILAIVQVERPIGRRLPPDVLYEILPDIPAHTPDVMLYTQLAVVGVYILAHPMRFTVVRRVGTVYGCIMLLRCFTVPATFLPDPSPLCKHRHHPPGTTCGDLIFSGHTVAFMISAFVIVRCVQRWWATTLVWCWTVCGLIAVVASKLHYTRDVVTAILVVGLIDHLAMTTIYLRPDRIAASRVLSVFELDYYLYHLSRRDQTPEEARKEGLCGFLSRRSRHVPDSARREEIVGVTVA